MTPPTLTLEQAREMLPRPSDFRAMGQQLPDWDTTPYTPGQMAASGVPHETIVRAFLRPDVLGAGFGETVCRIAETVLPVFEDASPGDNRPSAAIEAARVCFADPTTDNEAIAIQTSAAAAEAAADEARARYRHMELAAALAASWAAEAAAASALAAAGAAEVAAAGGRSVENVMEWAKVGSDSALLAAAAVLWAVRAGCPRAKSISIIEGAGQ